MGWIWKITLNNQIIEWIKKSQMIKAKKCYRHPWSLLLFDYLNECFWEAQQSWFSNCCKHYEPWQWMTQSPQFTTQPSKDMSVKPLSANPNAQNNSQGERRLQAFWWAETLGSRSDLSVLFLQNTGLSQTHRHFSGHLFLWCLLDRGDILCLLGWKWHK